MTTFVHELISDRANTSPDKTALQIKNERYSYRQLTDEVNEIACNYTALSVKQGDRVGIYLPKIKENVQGMFACSVIGAVFVPINPVLKAQQAFYIAKDCQLKVLLINKTRLISLLPYLPKLVELETIVVIDSNRHSLLDVPRLSATKVITWRSFRAGRAPSNSAFSRPEHSNQLAAILYTSGSTGQPKGIMLSHYNIVLGAKAVSQYLELSANDKILVILPLSFDYGLNQLTSSFFVGASCVLLDYLLANDVINAIADNEITGIAAVPPLWVQLTKANWLAESTKSVRYFTNSGGVLPPETLAQLRKKMPCAEPFLMYGLTEAFRSSYLKPSELDKKVGSIGQAIPYTELLVIDEEGNNCNPHEVGELVHVGPLVTLGYWQNDLATSQRYKSVPKQATNAYNTSRAVYSGDYVKYDNEGFFYFITRKDMMIKTSGYRVSPHEIESILLQLKDVQEAVIVTSPCKDIGQAIIAIIVLTDASQTITSHSIIKHCQHNLANYMLPKKVIFLSLLPRNANGKIDIALLQERYGNHHE
jgi:acyl-CoA ligase (AMP-forming) (exosortase A-associated)